MSGVRAIESGGPGRPEQFEGKLKVVRGTFCDSPAALHELLVGRVRIVKIGVEGFRQCSVSREDPPSNTDVDMEAATPEVVPVDST